MKRIRACPPQVLASIFVISFLVGCSSIAAVLSGDKHPPPDPAAKAQAQAALVYLSQINANLINFKGIGKIRVWQRENLRIDERIAWIGSETTKFSMAVLIGGLPTVKMASDGKWFYYYETGPDKPIYRKIAASDANLKRLISLSVKITDVINLLAGRVPIREHHSAILEEQLPPQQGYVLVLEKRWQGVTEKIYLDDTKTRVHQVEFYHRSGDLDYRARFDELQTVNGYLVPARLSITNGKDADVVLDVIRLWVDVAVNPAMFVLKPPD